MDINMISGTAMLMQAAQARQGISTSMIKIAADQQKQMADMLAQSVQNAPKIAVQSDFNFSIYV